MLDWNFKKLMPHLKSASVNMQSFIQKLLSNFESAPSNLWNYKVSSKTKTKKICYISNKRPPNCLIAKYRAKVRILKFGTKKALLKYFGQQFWKTIVIFEISTLEFALLQSFVQKIKILKFGKKFGTGTWKYCCHIWNQRPQICLAAKFGAKVKILKFETKNTWFGYFWTGSWKLYCHILNQLHRICLISKFLRKTKMPKLGTNNVLFEYFWARIWKWYCHIWNQHSRICLISRFLRKKTNVPYLGIFGLEF